MKLNVVLIVTVMIVLVSCNQDSDIQRNIPVETYGEYSKDEGVVQEFIPIESGNSLSEIEIDEMFKEAQKSGKNVKTGLYSRKVKGYITEDTLKRFTRAIDGKYVIINYDVSPSNFPKSDSDMPGFFAYHYSNADGGRWFIYIRNKQGRYQPVSNPCSIPSGSGYHYVINKNYLEPAEMGDGEHGSVIETWLLVSNFDKKN